MQEKTIQITTYTLTDDELMDLLRAAHTWGFDSGAVHVSGEAPDDVFGTDWERLLSGDFENLKAAGLDALSEPFKHRSLQ